MSRALAFNNLLECLSYLVHGSKGGPRGDRFRWPEVVALAHEYRVSSALACALGRSVLTDRVPREVTNFLATLSTHERLRNESAREAAIEVGRILNNIGVVPVVMKGGAHILTRLYCDPGARHVSDLDLLVPASRIDECRKVLGTHEFKPLSDYSHPRAHDSPLLSREGLSVPIELHHQVLAFPHWNFLSPEEMHRSATRTEISGATISVPAPINAVLHNIAHAQMNDHDYLYGRLDLRGLLDLALLTKAHGDNIVWSEIEQRFADAGWQSALTYHLRWARRLGAKFPVQDRMSTKSKLLHWRAEYHIRKPRALNLSFRILRPLILLRRELSDRHLRRRLARNLLRGDWWRRHLRMLRGA
jgi:hypothetical protein